VKEAILNHRESGSYANMIDTMKKTKLEKYGDENYNNVGRGKKTKLEKYGDENYNNRDKMKQTNLERYGQNVSPTTVSSTTQRAQSGEIGFKSNLYKRYLEENHVTNVSQLPEIKHRIKLKQQINVFNTIIDRCSNIVIPLFDVTEFDGVGYYDKLYRFKCNRCGTEFEDYLYSGHIPRCKTCYPSLNIGISYAEKEISDYIRTILPHVTIIENDRSVLSGKELDIYIPEKKIAIEYNGNYWHSESTGNKDKNYHLNKTKKCNEQNIRLIHIFEDEWLYKQDIVKNRLKHILGIQTKKIYGRNTVVREISPKEKGEFLEKTHIQGNDKSKIKIGLFYENELVSVMTFSKRVIFKNQQWELSRFSTKYNVIGGASKLLKYFVRTYNPEKIISYSDIRWNTGKIYETLGFIEVKQTPPGYFYLLNNQRINRINFQKHKLNEKLEVFDVNLTEWQNMQLNGYDRIWDCGNYKYIWESDGK